MDTRRIVYLVATGLFCIGIFPGAVMDIVQPAMVVEAMTKIQLPMYLLVLIGVWKILGAVALAFPRFRTLNEWAYAGFFFDLTGELFFAKLHNKDFDTGFIFVIATTMKVVNAHNGFNV